MMTQYMENHKKNEATSIKMNCKYREWEMREEVHILKHFETFLSSIDLSDCDTVDTEIIEAEIGDEDIYRISSDQMSRTESNTLDMPLQDLLEDFPTEERQQTHQLFHDSLDSKNEQEKIQQERNRVSILNVLQAALHI